MNSFAVLADDVEDADDLAPVTKVVAQEEVEVTRVAPVKKDSRTNSYSQDERRDTQRDTRHQDDRRDNRYSGRGGYRGGRGRGGRGRGRGRGGGGGRGGSHGRFGREGRERDSEGWERRGDGPRQDQDRQGRFDRDRHNRYDRDRNQDRHRESNGTFEDKPDKAVTVDDAPKDEVKPEDFEGGNEAEKEPEAKEVVVEEKSMGLDEYLKQKKSAALGVGLRRADAPTRKANVVGGKMAPLRKVEEAAETSIFSAVATKEAKQRPVKERPAEITTDATSEFFRSQPRRGRGRGRGGYRDYRNDYDYRDGSAPKSRFDRSRGPNAPNVDDTNAFPSLSA